MTKIDDICVKIVFDETLLAKILKCLAEPKKYEIAHYEIEEVVDNGLQLMDLTALNRLGLRKDQKTLKERRTTAVKKWLEYMAKKGWYYDVQVEIGGLRNNGFVQLKKELPNEKLLVLLQEVIKPKVVKGITPDLVITDNLNKIDVEAICAMNDGDYIPIEDDEMITDDEPAGICLETYPDGNVGIGAYITENPIVKAQMKKALEEKDKIEEKLMERFENETGKNAIYNGKVTKNYVNWKKNVLTEDKK